MPGLLDHLLDRADEIEGFFRCRVIAAFKNGLATGDSVV
jgi:hypothetical protein